MGAREQFLDKLVVKEGGVHLSVAPEVWAAAEKKLPEAEIGAALKGAAHSLAQQKPSQTFSYTHQSADSGLLMLPLGTPLGEDSEGKPVLLTEELLVPANPEAALRLLHRRVQPGQQFALVEVPDAEAAFIRETAPAIIARVTGQRRETPRTSSGPRLAMLDIGEAVTAYEVSGIEPPETEPDHKLVAVLPMDRLHYQRLIMDGLPRRFAEIALPAPKVLTHLSPQLLRGLPAFSPQPHKK
jgi:hypothetical protein